MEQPRLSNDELTAIAVEAIKQFKLSTNGNGEIAAIMNIMHVLLTFETSFEVAS